MRAWWRNVLDGFWFVPGGIAAAHIALAFLLIQVDRAAGPQGVSYGFGGDAGAARDVLSTIAGSLITVAGLAFSITIVVLTMVSSQFTPRALRSFLADRVNQVVAGSFVGIFAYCLVVLRAVRGDDIGDRFVPGLSVSIAIVLGLVALALLLVFIHHMGQSVQLSHIVARIGHQTLGAIDVLYPEEYGHEVLEPGARLVEEWRREREPAVVRPNRPGYVESISVEEIADALSGDRPRAHVAVRPGDFVTEVDALVEAWPPEALSDDREGAVRRAVAVANERQPGQDAAFGLRQLTDIALKALSTGVNDPSTALAALGYIQAALERLAAREIPGGARRLGEATIVAASRGFDEFAEEPLGALARPAAESMRVAAALLGTIGSVGRRARAVGAEDRLPVLARLAEAVVESARPAAANERERAVLEEAYERAREAVGEAAVAAR